MITYAYRDPDLQYDEFLALESACFVTDHGQTTSPELFQKRLTRMFWTARDESGAVVGFVQSKRSGNALFLSNMAVAPAYRRQGISSHLLKLAEEHARSLGCARLELGVLANNAPALGAYLKFGFTQRGPAEHRYEFDLPLWYESRLPEVDRMDGVETILFMIDGKCVGDTQLNDALGCRELTLSDPSRDLLGAISAVAKQMRPDAKSMGIMTAEANVIAEFERMGFTPESVHLTMTKDLA